MAEQQVIRDKLLTPFIERQLSLTGAKAPEGRFPCYMKVEFKEKNNNRITLHFGSGIYGEDQRQKTISLDVPAYTFGVLCQQARQIATQPPGFEFRGHKINGIRQKRPGDQTKGPATGWDGTVFIGKDSQGVCYICAMAKGVNKIKTPFLPDAQFVSMVDVRTNEPASPADVSCDYSFAWGQTLEPIVGHLLVNHPFDFRAEGKYAEKNQGGGWKDRNGGGGYQNNNGGGQGGYQRQQQNNHQQGGGDDMSFLDTGTSGGGDSFDNDIPM